jgi:IS30 family transposase
MARHVQLTIDTGVAVYFCDPKSPWQRGTNENTEPLREWWTLQSLRRMEHAEPWEVSRRAA